MLNRRTFLKSFSTTAAASMLPAGIASTILKDQWNTFNLDATISNDNSEVFWETNKRLDNLRKQKENVFV